VQPVIPDPIFTESDELIDQPFFIPNTPVSPRLSSLNMKFMHVFHNSASVQIFSASSNSYVFWKNGTAASSVC
jgi:hypothetical protein